jgi:phage replication-related protein YjqB (UPF0714/DUF867 family)
MDNSGGMSFAELLEQPNVVEQVAVRERFGFLAYHGGPVERVTTLIAKRASDLADASFYGIDQPAERPLHLPSTRFDPEDSTHLRTVIDHVDVVCTIHGYGRDMDKQHVLLGGQNRELAEHVADHLRPRLSKRYPIITDLNQIPKELRGVHARNPANLPRDGGVQIELPPALRWNWKAGSWADAPGLEPTTAVQATIDGLAAAAIAWMRPEDSTLDH